MQINTYTYKHILAYVNRQNPTLDYVIRIARSTLLLDDFVPRVDALFKRMINKGADKLKMLQQYTRTCVNHSISLDKFASGSDYIIERVFQGSRFVCSFRFNNKKRY